MPNPLQNPWSKIIPFIPVGNHAVEVAADQWRPHLMRRGLGEHFDAIFLNSPTARITRTRLKSHRYENQQQKCLEILMWGYPTGGRGDLRLRFLTNLQRIAATSSDRLPWLDYYSNLHAVGGLGISTITKLAYFYEHDFGGLPSLILDDRIIDVVSTGKWEGLHIPGLKRTNAVGRYPDYLQTVSAIAAQLSGCNPDQIEFLLFSWGDAF